MSFTNPKTFHEQAIEQTTELLSELRSMKQNIAKLEEELREEASGAQDGYLLDVANRLRKIRE